VQEESEDKQKTAGAENALNPPPDFETIPPLIHLLEQIENQQYEIKLS
jgi:hypothetical protein